MKDNTSAPPRVPSRWPLLGAGSLLAVIALLLYRPWVDRPFDTLDFSEFLPLLTGHGSIISRFIALSRYYIGDHARLNLLSYAALAAKWSLLGPSPLYWQWARVLQMGLLVAGVYLLLRRLALRPYPALAGASLFVVSRVVGEAWTRMTMGEPLGLLCALGALLLASTWRQRADALPRAVIAGALMALAVLAKEMLIGLLPLVWLIGTARGADGRLGRPDLGGEAPRWIFWSGILPLAAFGAALLVAMQGGSEGFTALYGRVPVTLGSFLLLLARPWFVQGTEPGLAALALPANACLALTILGGLRIASKDGEWRTHALWCVVAAAGLSVAFAILYVPWPYTYLYYTIPFQLGAALLLGLGVQLIADRGRHGRALAAAAVAALFWWAAPPTGEAAARTIAVQQVNGALVATLGRVPYATRFVVARHHPAPQPWMGTGPTLRRYALATGAARTLPPGGDISCEDARELLRRGLGRTIFISYPGNCGGILSPSAHLSQVYRTFQTRLLTARMVTDSFTVDVLVDREAMTVPPGRP